MESFIFEVCIDSTASALAAQGGGAQRVELCDNLIEGGTTPSIGMVKAVCSRLRIPVHVLLRPRGGDFCYSEDEMEVMELDIDAIKAAGAAGVVLGVLSPNGSVDMDRTRRLVTRARPMSVTFHRAIDVAADASAALAACVQLGIDRVLSSGQASSAPSPRGKRGLCNLVEAARHQHGGQISIIGAAGVTEGNVAELVRDTGLTEVHASTGRVARQGQMRYRPRDPIFMGGEKRNIADDPADREGTIGTEFALKEVQAERVRQYVDILRDACRQSGAEPAEAEAVPPPSLKKQKR